MCVYIYVLHHYSKLTEGCIYISHPVLREVRKEDEENKVERERKAVQNDGKHVSEVQERRYFTPSTKGIMLAVRRASCVGASEVFAKGETSSETHGSAGILRLTRRRGMHNRKEEKEEEKDEGGRGEGE